MEKKVIKFNLVGAIFVLLLIIGAIVGTIVWINNPKEKQEKESNETPTENKQAQMEQVQIESENTNTNDKDIEVITIGDEEKVMTMEKAQGSLGYTMKYDVESFYFDKAVDGKDEFRSLNSDTIYMYVMKEETNFSDRVNDIILDSSRGNNYVDYKINQIDINGRNTYKEIMEGTEETIIYYYIEAEGGCYVIEIHCGNQFTGMTIPVIEKMVESFEIID